MKPNPITGILGVENRSDVDVAAQVEFIEQLPGDTEFDQIAKAQASAPQVRARILALEDCLRSLVGALIDHEKSDHSPLVERARFLLKLKDRIEVPEDPKDVD